MAESASWCYIEYSWGLYWIHISWAQSLRLWNSSGRIWSLHFKLQVVITLYALSFSPTASRCWSLFVAHPLLVSQHNRDDVWILLSASFQWKAFLWGSTPCITLIENQGVTQTIVKHRLKRVGVMRLIHNEVKWVERIISLLSLMLLLLFGLFFLGGWCLEEEARGTNKLHALCYVLLEAASTLSCLFWVIG